MAKKWLKMKDLANLDKIAKDIKDSLSDKGSALADALVSFIEEIRKSDVEINETDFAARVQEVVASFTAEQVPPAVTDFINKKIEGLKNVTSAPQKVSKELKNEIAKAILKSGGKHDIKDVVENILVKNGITGLAFPDVVDFQVVDKWEDLNPLMSLLHQTFFTKFFYTTDDINLAAVIAKKWTGSMASTTDKIIQQLTLTGKSISPEFVYKRQQIAMSDLIKLQDIGNESDFLQWLNRDLEQILVNSIVSAILVGDAVNASANQLSQFEAIGSKTASDVFTTIITAAGSTPTVAEYRRTADAVINPSGKSKVAVMTQQNLTNLSQFIYAAGGTQTYKTKEEVAGILGVSDIIVSDIIGVLASNIAAIVLIPDGYWIYSTPNTDIDISYPTYEKNVINYQREKLTAGAIHDLYSTAVLKIPGSSTK